MRGALKINALQLEEKGPLQGKKVMITKKIFNKYELNCKLWFLKEILGTRISTLLESGLWTHSHLRIFAFKCSRSQTATPAQRRTQAGNVSLCQTPAPSLFGWTLNVSRRRNSSLEKASTFSLFRCLSIRKCGAIAAGGAVTPRPTQHL